MKHTKIMSIALLGALAVLPACGDNKSSENKADGGPGAAQAQPAKETEALQSFKQYVAKQETTDLQSDVLKVRDLDKNTAVYAKATLFLLDNQDYVLDYIEVTDTTPKDGKASGVPQSIFLDGKWKVEGTQLVLDNIGRASINSAEKNSILLTIDKNICTEGLAGKAIAFHYKPDSRALSIRLRDRGSIMDALKAAENSQNQKTEKTVELQ